MGQYSLDNYEIYKSYKVRPKPLAVPPENTGRGQFHEINFKWSELESNRGTYHFDKLDQALSEVINPLLVIDPELPTWVDREKELCFGKFIRRIGSHRKCRDHLIGIVVTTISDTHQEWDAYIESFASSMIIVDLQESKLIRYYQKKSIDFGIRVIGDDESWLECCEAFGRYHLQDTWEKRPVLLQLKDGKSGKEIQREAHRWHVALSNQKRELGNGNELSSDELGSRKGFGYSMELRRVTYPKIVSSKGVLPIRFWFVNSGTAPCYQNIHLKIKISKDSKEWILPLTHQSKEWLVGDITQNEMVKLPELECGVCDVWVGLFFDNNKAMELSMEGVRVNGFYRLGQVEVDEANREELCHIWDHYYPEGYYPLEDPKEPNS